MKYAELVLYIYEDESGEAAQSLTPPTEEDLERVALGSLFVFRVDVKIPEDHSEACSIGASGYGNGVDAANAPYELPASTDMPEEDGMGEHHSTT